MTLKGLAATSLLILSLNPIHSAIAAEVSNDISSSEESRITRTVTIPEDYFSPFIINVNRGDVVRFVNRDEEAHTVTSAPMYSSFPYRSINRMIPAETADGRPGSTRIRFNSRGTFTYYCTRHAHLAGGQPVNGGTDGSGIAGRPMMGVVIVR